MDNHFNTPAEVIDLSIKACENKTRLPLGKMILLGIMAGAFIAFGGATSSTAAHAVENVGVARALAGCIFPVGLMLIVFLGGELFTGNCLIIMDVFDKRVTWGGLFRDLFIVFFSNLIGALCVDLLNCIQWKPKLLRWASRCLYNQSCCWKDRNFTTAGNHFRNLM